MYYFTGATVKFVNLTSPEKKNENFADEKKLKKKKEENGIKYLSVPSEVELVGL